MKYILSTKDKNFQNNFKKVLNLKRRQSEANRSVVSKIIKDVQKNGDQSLIKYSKKFDKILLNKKNIQLSNKEIVSIFNGGPDFNFQSQRRGRIQVVKDEIFVISGDQSVFFKLICSQNYPLKD